MTSQIIGEVFELDIEHEPMERYDYREGKHHLDIFVESPSKNAFKSIQYSVCEFALYSHREVLLFCFRIRGYCEWKALPFNIHMSPERDITLPKHPLSFLEKENIHITLVDTADQTVKAYRVLSVSREFGLELSSIIRRQACYDFDFNNYCMTKTTIFNKHRTAEDVVDNANVRCMGKWSSLPGVKNQVANHFW